MMSGPGVRKATTMVAEPGERSPLIQPEPAGTQIASIMDGTRLAAGVLSTALIPGRAVRGEAFDDSRVYERA
ncbi:hypothetical protein LWP59_16290 [Amycolatopsis acidiphila]|uniref:Uncharacterized protein n=1 Tax=Amycolatopsis acidiphila TaxID=715473 RepID=A0A557ZYR8_9PSEU|nr:hypothetical protein [Amycolatopsis acidiphila]TVT17165.1 hypothetical protein FNH06_32440 [Amycolatopsis acidiphila]UIJ63075.1 hypothetical protein LWP59_16290 [Amycolatopsis acidiphila]GHG65986.1 hypothetical protein GCM10017788_23900 [Amycolatopsis acidiphila]